MQNSKEPWHPIGTYRNFPLKIMPILEPYDWLKPKVELKPKVKSRPNTRQKTIPITPKSFSPDTLSDNDPYVFFIVPPSPPIYHE